MSPKYLNILSNISVNNGIGMIIQNCIISSLKSHENQKIELIFEQNDDHFWAKNEADSWIEFDFKKENFFLIILL